MLYLIISFFTELAQFECALPIHIAITTPESNEQYINYSSTCSVDSIDQEVRKNRKILNEYGRYFPRESSSSSWTQIAFYNYTLRACPDRTNRKSRYDCIFQQYINRCEGYPTSVNIPSK